LDDGGEVELVASTAEATQAHALEAMLNLQVGKAHLHFLALIARPFKFGRAGGEITFGSLRSVSGPSSSKLDRNSATARV
jgi:hypothetical protein